MNRKTTYTIWVILLLITISSLFGTYYNSKDKGSTPTSKYDELTLPIINLPLRYFSDADTHWGSVNPKKDSDNKNTWVYAAIDNGYQSFPTTTITLSSKDYSNDIKVLPPIKSLKESMNEDPGVWTEWEWLFKEQIKKYGDIASRFLMSNHITSLDEFDVDGDSKMETIISTCGTGGNHCPHEIIIVKNGKIIFSVHAGLVGLNLIKSETGNGFYVLSVPTDGNKWGETGLCCSIGYMKTRFVYEHNAFKPVYEQEVLYFKVNNTE